MNTDFKNDNLWFMKGDCLERMKEIPDGSVDIFLSDIPYGINYSEWDVKHSNNNSALLGSSPAQSKSNLFKKRGKPLNGWSSDDKLIAQQYQEFTSDYLKEVYRVLKPCSFLISFTGRQLQHRYTVAAENVGFTFRDIISWDKKNAPFRAQRIDNILKSRQLEPVGEEYRLGNLAPRIEPVVVMSKPYKQGGTITDEFIKNGTGVFNSKLMKSNYLEISSKVVGKLHETQKPVELMEILVETFSTEGQTVLDCFSGSFTTGVACVNLNRKFIGIEMDDHYYDIGTERVLSILNQATKNL